MAGFRAKRSTPRDVARGPPSRLIPGSCWGRSGPARRHSGRRLARAYHVPQPPAPRAGRHVEGKKWRSAQDPARRPTSSIRI